MAHATAAPAAADLSPVRYTPDLVSAPFDPAVGAALAAAGSEPVSPSYLDPSLDIRLQHGSEVARRQDAVGAIDVAGVAARHRLAHGDPHAADGVESAAGGCAGDSHRGGHHDQRRDGAAAAADPGDRRRQRRAAAERRAATRQRPRGSARAIRRRRRIRYRGGDGPAVGPDRGVDNRRAHRPHRLRLHRTAARGLAARAEPVGATGCPQRPCAATAYDSRPHGRRPVQGGHHRQSRRLLHSGDRTQPAAAGAAQRPPGADPGAGWTSTLRRA